MRVDRLPRHGRRTTDDATETDTRRLVDRLWPYCNVLRDDGVGTIEYREQLTYLLLLTMAHERENRTLNPERIVPTHLSWQRLLDADGDDLEVTYRRILEELGRRPGMLTPICTGGRGEAAPSLAQRLRLHAVLRTAERHLLRRT